MDNISIQCGQFIAKCRKEKGLTQQELAELLNVTNRAVSKWETGKGIPDVTVLIELSKVLDCSVDEILKGKRNEQSNAIHGQPVAHRKETVKSEDNSGLDTNGAGETTQTIAGYMVEKAIEKFKMRAVLSVFFSAAGIFLPVFIAGETGDKTGLLFGCWLQVCSVGIYYYYYRLLRIEILNYNVVSSNNMSVKDISIKYLRVLRIMWPIVPVIFLLSWL